MERIAPQLIYQYFTCPHWIWFDRFGDQKRKGEINELQQKLLEQGIVHEERFISEFVKGKDVCFISETKWDAAIKATEKAMRSGAEIIYQGRIRNAQFEGIPDLLVRVEISSDFGTWSYEPVDIKSGKNIKDAHKYQLTLYSLILKSVQGVMPARAGAIVANGDFQEFTPADFEDDFWKVIEKIRPILLGDKPPLQLTKACLQSPWFSECVRQAEEDDDIALLYKVDRRSLVALRDHGIRTTEDARRADVVALNDEIPYLKRNGLERMKLQAESLKMKKIFVRKPPGMPAASITIYFDIEGDPLLGIEYLFGFLIDARVENKSGFGDATFVYKSFLAERFEDEKKMWLAFLDWARTLPDDMIIFHYAAYERSRLTMLFEKYASEMTADHKVALKKFTDRMFDLNETIKECFVLPLYFYGLKDVAKYLGFKWESKKASGAQSIFWYEEWLERGDRAVLQTIMRYNEDDVRATQFLHKWIASQCGVLLKKK